MNVVKPLIVPHASALSGDTGAPSGGARRAWMNQRAVNHSVTSAIASTTRRGSIETKNSAPVARPKSIPGTSHTTSGHDQVRGG